MERKREITPEEDDALEVLLLPLNRPQWYGWYQTSTRSLVARYCFQVRLPNFLTSPLFYFKLLNYLFIFI